MKALIGFKPPRIAMLLLGITVGLWYFSPQGTLLYLPYELVAGICIILGFSVMIWAWLLFKRVATAVCPTATTTQIVTKGPFSCSRNPMYLGMLLMLTGASFLMGSLPSVLAPVVFFVIIDKVFIPYEEDKLREFLGDGYAEYFQNVRRWV